MYHWLSFDGIKSAFRHEFKLPKAIEHNSVQHAIYPPNTQGLFFDFVADTGDGFDSTYTVAAALAQEFIQVRNETLERGKLLFVGGDLCYPYPTKQLFQERFINLYSHSLKSNGICDACPIMYAVLGNHDYVDGGRTFSENIIDNEKLGAYTTPQNNAYFSVQLMNNWLIFGLDDQYSEGEIFDISQDQLQYFRGVLNNCTSCSVVIIMHSPFFILQNAGSRTMQLIRESNVKVILTGDMHYYAHYVSNTTGIHLIVCGGGGAFKHSTAGLHHTVSLNITGNFDNFSLLEAYPPKQFFNDFAISLPWIFIQHVFIYLLHIELIFAEIITIRSLENLLLPLPPWLMYHVAILNLALYLLYTCITFTFILSCEVIYLFCYAYKSHPHGLTFGIWPLLYGAIECVSLFMPRYMSYTLYLVQWLTGQFTISYIFDILPQQIDNICSNNWQKNVCWVLALPVVAVISATVTFVIAWNLACSGLEDKLAPLLSIAGYNSFLRIRLTSNELTIYPILMEKVNYWLANPIYSHTNPSHILFDEIDRFVMFGQETVVNHKGS